MIVSRFLRRFAETCAAHGLEKGAGALRPDRAAALGAALLQGLGPLTGANQMALRNLGRVFSPTESARIAKKVWGNLGQTLLEYPHINRLYQDGAIEFCGTDIIRDASRSGGAVIFSGHLANWECMPLIARKAGCAATVLHRAPNNPSIAQILERCRPTDAVRYVAKSTQGTAQAFATLSHQGLVSFLIDHRYNRGVQVNFLGAPAMVADTAAVMVRRYGCPLIPMRAERIGRCRYRVTVMDPLPLDLSLPPQDFSRHVMQTAMTLLESWIMERPDQWFWMQRLWK